MTESAYKKDRSPLYNRPKTTMRTTESHHKNDRKPPRGQQEATMRTKKATMQQKKTSCAMDPTAQHFSLFTFHFKRRNSPFDSLLLPYIAPIQCSTYGARMAVKIPLRVRPSEA